MTYPGSVVYVPSTADLEMVVHKIGSRLCGVVVIVGAASSAVRTLNTLRRYTRLSVPISVHILGGKVNTRMVGRVADDHLHDMISLCRLDDRLVTNVDDRQVLAVAQQIVLKALLRYRRRRQAGTDESAFISAIRLGGSPGPYADRPRLLKLAS